MKMRPAGDDPLERVAIAFNLAPLPAAHALYGMTAGRTGNEYQIIRDRLGGSLTAG